MCGAGGVKLGDCFSLLSSSHAHQFGSCLPAVPQSQRGRVCADKARRLKQ